MNTYEAIIYNFEEKITEALKEICEDACVSIGHVKMIDGKVFIAISFCAKL